MSLRAGIAMALLLGAAQAQGPVWTSAGPSTVTDVSLGNAVTAGPLAALALSPDGTTLYAGGLGGVWRFDGTAWIASGNGAPVSALAVSPAGTLFAGLGDVNDGTYGHAGAGLLATTDGGATWTALGAVPLAGLAVTRVAVDPADASHLLVAGVLAPDSPPGAQPGLYASIDGGATWGPPLIAGAVWDLAWDGAHILAATATGLDLSADDGTSFTPLGVAAASGTRATVCLQPGGGFLALFAGPAPSLLAIAADGSTAQPVALPGGVVLSNLALALAADGSHLWVGGADLWVRAASGAWTNLTNAGQPGAIIHGQQHAILPAPGNGLWLANDGGLWWAPANGSLEDMNAGLGNFAALGLALPPSAAPPAGLVAALAGGGLARTGASAWTAASAGPGLAPSLAPIVALVAAAPGDPSGQSLYAVGRSSALLYHSSDGGATLGPATAVPGVAGTLTALAAAPAQVWLGTSSGQFMDGGGDSFPSPSGGAAITALAASGAATIWLAAGTQLWSSTDGGADWAVAAAPGGTVSALALDPADAHELAAATADGVAFSLDGGASWAALAAGVPAAPVTGLAFDPQENLWATTLGRGLWTVSLAGGAVTLTLATAPASATVGSSIQLTATAASPLGPLAGAAVTFAESEAGHADGTASATSDSHGVATATLALPSLAGAVAFAAATTGPGGPVYSSSVVVTATAAAPATLIVVSGANQAQATGSVLAQPVVLQLADAYGNGVANASIAVSDGAGYSAAFTTDAEGRASVAGFVLPNPPQTVALTAAAGMLSVTWAEIALPPPDYTLVLSPPGGAAAPNQIVTLTVQMVAIGAFNAAVSLTCGPVPGCVGIVPASLAPGGSAQVSFDTGTLGEDETSAVVTVAGDATHAASATLALQGLTLSPSAPTLAVDAGAAAALPLAVASVNGLAGPVTFAATLADGSALPSALVVTFDPATPTLAADGSATTVQLTVSAAAASGGGVTATPRGPGAGTGPAALLALAALLAAALVCFRRRRLRRAWVLGALALVLAGCGGGTPTAVSDPPVPELTGYALVVTAQVAGLQVSAPIAVTVSAP